MDIDVNGKNIVITGASGGIGRGLALGLAAEGARIGVLGRDRKRAQGVVDEIGDLTGAPAALALEADVSDEARMTAAATEIDAEWGRVDALISNAGFLPPAQRVLDVDVATVHEVLDTNVVGCLLATKHFAPLMIRNGGGRIVYMSSVIGQQAGPGAATYGGSKAAVDILTNVVHQELADQGIRTVAIAPGLTDTPGMRAYITEEHLTRVAANYPDGRIGQPEDIVALIGFLCSEAARHLSGTVVTVRPPATR